MMTLNELKENESWEEALIVLNQSHFTQHLPEIERSFFISRDNKYFCESNSDSLFGRRLAGPSGEFVKLSNSFICGDLTLDYCCIIAFEMLNPKMH